MRMPMKSFVWGFCLSITGVVHAQHGGHNMPPPNPSVPSKPFPTDVTGLSEVTTPKQINLSDGDRYTLEAKAAKQKVSGQWIRRLAYNGSIPGPIFRVKQGSSVTVTLKNGTEAPATLHPHGLRVTPSADGVPGVGQNPIQPGQSYEYALRFPDAGIYWYHPHIREDYGQEAGLYGVFIVEPSDSQAYNPVHREIPLVLDDVLIDPKQPFDTAKVTHTLMGRFGNVNLVNGVENPTFTVTQGETIRFYALNTANTRVFALAIPGLKLKVVGGDNGLFENEQWSERVILAPGERSIIEAQFDNVGVFDVRNNKPKNPNSIARIEVKPGSFDPLATDFDQLRQNTGAVANLAAVRQQLTRKIDKKLKLTLTMDHSKLPMGEADSDVPSADGIEWDDEMPAMNMASDNKNVVWKLVDEDTRKENSAINWSIKQGQYTRISIFNDPNSMHPMQHPIHFHGQRFVIASVDGKPVTNLVWKDTALVPKGARVDIILEASNPGNWMAHCHISEHLEASMMLNFKVVQ
jgi:FtsP/CotA-like multicopper oxidase with cupredoxin domain